MICVYLEPYNWEQNRASDNHTLNNHIYIQLVGNSAVWWMLFALYATCSAVPNPSKMCCYKSFLNRFKYYYYMLWIKWKWYQITKDGSFSALYANYHVIVWWSQYNKSIQYKFIQTFFLEFKQHSQNAFASVNFNKNMIISWSNAIVFFYFCFLELFLELLLKLKAIFEATQRTQQIVAFFIYFGKKQKQKNSFVCVHSIKILCILLYND